MAIDDAEQTAQQPMSTIEKLRRLAAEIWLRAAELESRATSPKATNDFDVYFRAAQFNLDSIDAKEQTLEFEVFRPTPELDELDGRLTEELDGATRALRHELGILRELRALDIVPRLRALVHQLRQALGRAPVPEDHPLLKRLGTFGEAYQRWYSGERNSALGVHVQALPSEVERAQRLSTYLVLTDNRNDWGHRVTEQHDRIAYRQVDAPYVDARCIGCGVPVGHLHMVSSHGSPMCVEERCPVCHSRALLCSHCERATEREDAESDDESFARSYTARQDDDDERLSGYDVDAMRRETGERVTFDEYESDYETAGESSGVEAERDDQDGDYFVDDEYYDDERADEYFEHYDELVGVLNALEDDEDI